MSENVVNLTQENFEAVTQGETPVFVDFWASWCGTCKMLSPVIDNLAQEYEGRASICKLNVDENPDLATKYRVMSLPTVVVIKNGELIDKAVGARTKEEYQKMIEKTL